MMNETQNWRCRRRPWPKHDSDGRLVSAAIDCGQPFPSGEDNTWLVAIDGSVHSLRATAQATHLAGLMKGCAIHLPNVQPWVSKEAAESELLDTDIAAIEAARRLDQTHDRRPYRDPLIALGARFR